MKSTILALAASLTALASASPILEARQNVQSKPFNLFVSGAANKTLNGRSFASCHEGAGLEALCLGLDNPSTYHFNTSANQIVDKKYGKTGLLTYELIGANFKESQGFSLYLDPSTNVAIGFFEPSDNFQYVGFDASNKMNIQTYLDDTVSPPTDTANHGFYRWYVCTTNFEGYTYQTLSWVQGKYPPQNPSCQKIDVVRKFL